MKRIIITVVLLLLGYQTALATDNGNPQQLTPQQLQQLLQAAKANNRAAAASNQAAAATATAAAATNQAAAAQIANAAASAPATGGANSVAAVDTGADLRDDAFAGVASSVLPLSPQQIRTLHRLYDQTQRAAAEFPGVPPKPTSTSLMVSLSPGATPPVIRLSAGFVTSLVFLDRSGAPWPIKAYDLGDPNAFNIKWDEKSNTLLVQAITQYKAANLAVILQGLNTPVMLTLLPGQSAVDYRVDLYVPGLGPYGVATSNGLPAAASPLLLNILSGVPPAGATQLQVTPEGYADVWLWRGNIYVRTRATILSPAWVSIMSSSDGTHAYKMLLAPLIIASQNGKPINLTIQGY